MTTMLVSEYNERYFGMAEHMLPKMRVVFDSGTMSAPAVPEVDFICDDEVYWVLRFEDGYGSRGWVAPTDTIEVLDLTPGRVSTP